MARKEIDCLLIGHNDMDFVEHEKSIRKMGVDSGAYRDLNRKFIWYNSRPYHLAELLNLFAAMGNGSRGAACIKPSRRFENLSLGIAYLASYLDRHGLTFDYANSFQDEKGELSKKLAKENIQTIAILTTLYVTVFPIIEIVNFIKRYNSSAQIIIGGPFVTTQIRTLTPLELEHLFQFIDGADFYVNSSQGEATLVKIIDALNNHLPPEQINNIYYKTSNGYKATPVSIENNKLSENPVDWSLFKDRIGRDVGIRTSISCLFSCAFCGYPEHAGKYQELAVEEIENEINTLRKIKPDITLHFIDDSFNVPVKRFKHLLRMMVENQFKLQWTSYFRCQYADREMVELMKESGCIGVFIGFESGNDQMLQRMKKNARVEKYLEGMALLKEYGIMTFGTFIIGFPGETNETIKDTIQLIKESKLDFYRTNLWYYSHFTPIWKEREKYHIKGANYEWTHQTMDSKTASALIDQMILQLEKPIPVIQYDSDYFNVFHLVHRAIGFGLTPEQIILFLEGFSQGIKEKLKEPRRKEVSFNVIMNLKRALGNDNPTENNTPCMDRYNAAFDY